MPLIGKRDFAQFYYWPSRMSLSVFYFETGGIDALRHISLGYGKYSKVIHNMTIHVIFNLKVYCVNIYK